MSTYIDDSHLAEIGEEYERFVGAYYESSCKNSIVIHQGAILGKKDTGIDLIVITDDTTYLLQCKYYKASSVIHSKHVSQLRGDANMFAYKYPEAKNVTPVLVAHCTFADDAIDNALVNKVQLKQLRYTAPYYRPGRCFVSDCDVNYELFLHALLKIMQHPEEQQPVSSDQTPVIPEQTAPKTEQTPPEPSHPPIISNHPVFRDESSVARIEPIFKDELDTGLPPGPRKTGYWKDLTVKHKSIPHEVLADDFDKMTAAEKNAVERGFFYYWWNFNSKSTVSAKNMLKNAFISLMKIVGAISGIIIVICIGLIPIIGPALVVIILISLVIALFINKDKPI